VRSEWRSRRRKNGDRVGMYRCEKLRLGAKARRWNMAQVGSGRYYVVCEGRMEHRGHWGRHVMAKR
jgi:hypothetical protein